MTNLGNYGKLSIGKIRKQAKTAGYKEYKTSVDLLMFRKGSKVVRVDRFGNCLGR